MTYIYFYNPVSRWLVEHIPEYIAPNVITLSGFMFTLVPFVNLFIRYGTNFDDEYPYHSAIPNSLLYFQGACYFLYRMLDEMDGKQARRTGNSTPLGLMFDHGCDAFSMGLVTLTLSKLFRCGN